MKFEFEIEGNKREFDIEKNNGKENLYTIEYKGKKTDFTIKRIRSYKSIVIDENNSVYDVFTGSTKDEKCVFFKGRGYKTKKIDKRRNGSGFEVEGIALVKSPLPGIIKRIEKKEGDEVKTGEGILFLEAMKMENEIKSPKTGILKKIYTKETDAVNAGDKLFVVE